LLHVYRLKIIKIFQIRQSISKRRKMTVFNFYIFNRDGQCIYYKEWNRTKQSGLSQEQEFKQMFGLITEMKSFVTKMSPGDL
jgi:hypothetical protein